MDRNANEENLLITPKLVYFVISICAFCVCICSFCVNICAFCVSAQRKQRENFDGNANEENLLIAPKLKGRKVKIFNSAFS